MTLKQTCPNCGGYLESEGKIIYHCPRCDIALIPEQENTPLNYRCPVNAKLCRNCDRYSVKIIGGPIETEQGKCFLDYALRGNMTYWVDSLGTCPEWKPLSRRAR